jgi:hypothetical protein
MAVRDTLERGIRTADLMGADGEARGWQRVGTAAFGSAVADRVRGKATAGATAGAGT